MKNFTWKQWLGIGIFAAYIIALIVLTFTKPMVMFFGLLSLALGVVGTLLVKARRKDSK